MVVSISCAAGDCAQCSVKDFCEHGCHPARPKTMLKKRAGTRRALPSFCGLRMPAR